MLKKKTVNKEDCASIDCLVSNPRSCGRKISLNRKTNNSHCHEYCCLLCPKKCEDKEYFFKDIDPFKLLVFRGKYAKNKS